METILKENIQTQNNIWKIQNEPSMVEEGASEKNVDLLDLEKTLQKILETYRLEKDNLNRSQRALLNILEDYSGEKNNIETTQRAVMNILEDFSIEKKNSDYNQIALLNILDDYSVEKNNMETTQRAIMNIIEDYDKEKWNLENTQKAVLNILDDYIEEKRKVENTNENLISTNKELEQFIYVASHDLQEPIRTINSYLQLLEKRYKEKLDNNAKEFINYAVEGGKRMKTVILSLLDYSRLTRANPFEIINVNEVLKEILKDLSYQIRENNATITIEPLPAIYGDKVLIEQLFQNLISNAVKFKGEKNPVILISGKKNDTEYLFSIKDNGIGIQKEYGTKLFTIFQRLNTQEQYPGTGMGLAICKKIVEKHGGKIWFESEFGKGSTFYFTIKDEKQKE